MLTSPMDINALTMSPLVPTTKDCFFFHKTVLVNSDISYLVEINILKAAKKKKKKKKKTR